MSNQKMITDTGTKANDDHVQIENNEYVTDHRNNW